MKINMKKIVNKLAIVYVLITLLFIRKILNTELGLILYASTSILFMFYVLYINKQQGEN